MKGLIVYSSLTGNTEKMAQALYEGLSTSGEWTLSNVKEMPDWTGFDKVLLGGWADQGTLDKACLKYYEKIEKGKVALGLFMTLGAMPDSFHGKKCQETLELLLEGHNGLGVYLCPGFVAPALLARVEKMPESILPKDIKDQMIEAGKNSRYATKEEYDEVVDSILANLK